MVVMIGTPIRTSQRRPVNTRKTMASMSNRPAANRIHSQDGSLIRRPHSAHVAAAVVSRVLWPLSVTRRRIDRLMLPTIAVGPRIVPAATGRRPVDAAIQQPGHHRLTPTLGWAP
jgi:hypothetical protein